MLRLNKKQIIFFVFLIHYILYISIGVFFDSLLIGGFSALTTNILFILFFPYAKKKPIFLFMISLYSLLFNLSLLVGPELLYRNTISYSVSAYIILPILCFLLLLPLYFIKRPNLDEVLESRKTLIFIYLLSPIILFSFFYLTPYTFNTFLYGAKDIRTSLGENTILPESYLTTLSVGISMLYPLFIFLLFYASIVKASRVVIFILILGVLNGLIGGIIFAARDRFLWVPFFMLVNFWLWYPYIGTQLLKRMNRFMILFSIISIVFLVVFTLDRFSTSQTGVGGSLLVYYGAQPYVFSEAVAQHSNNLFYGLDLRFPLFLEILGIEPDKIIRDIPYQWMFGTIFTDFYMMGGWFYCILFIIFLNLVYTYIYLYKKNDPWFYVLFMMLHLQILIQGIFYFSLGFPGGNLYILLTVFLVFFLNIFNKVRLKL